jgi:hypothetical protein
VTVVSLPGRRAAEAARRAGLDTYTSALPAMDKSAADVVAGLIVGTAVSNR